MNISKDDHFLKKFFQLNCLKYNNEFSKIKSTYVKWCFIYSLVYINRLNTDHPLPSVYVL